MSKQMKAILRWLSPEEGGREAPPSGSEYITIAKFENNPDSQSGEAWSLVVDLSNSEKEAQSTVVNVHFLFEKAPQHLLKEGNEFGLYEGERKVAEGEILS